MDELTFKPFGAAKAITELARMLEAGFITKADYAIASAFITALKHPSMF